MIFYDEYDVPDDVADDFVQSSALGRLVTVGDETGPHIGVYPFVYEPGRIELHLNRADEQVADLQTNRRCVFEVDDVLASIPSYWIDPENATMATAYHRTVVFDCAATISGDADELVAQQTRLMGRYQPEGSFRALSAGDPMYETMLGMLMSVHLDVTRRRAKFKIGQNRSPEVRAVVADHLRARGRPRDADAARALDWTIDGGARPSAHPGHGETP
jgi:predicted FMN-binding regulatory protein PaiB